MNNFAVLYESFFEWEIYSELLNMVYNNYDYTKIISTLLLSSFSIFTIFYKIWDPISNSKVKWWVFLLVNAILVYAVTTTILYNNFSIVEYLGNYTGEEGEPEAGFFIVQMSFYSSLYSVLCALIFSIVPLRFISINNRYNPF